MNDATTRLALDLSTFWSKLLANYPRYGLDFSWPSVGSLNLILSHVFDVEELSEIEEQLVRGAAAYLATIACQTLESVGEGVQVEASIGEPFEISLTVSGEPFGAKRENLVIPVYSSLRAVLRSREAALRVFESLNAPEQWGDSRVSLFAAALFTGLHSFAEGKWARSRYQDVKKQLARVVHTLAETSAKYYSIVYPTEAFGAVAQNYLGRILPPAGFEEDFFCGRAAFTLALTLKQSNLDEQAKREVAINSALSPDVQLSAPGLAVALALSLADPSEKLLAISDGYGPSRLLLKQAMTLARQALELPAVFKHATDSELSPEIELLLQGEMELGLLPHWRVELSELLPVPALPQLLYWNMSAQARASLDAHLETNERSTALILQGIYLDLVNGQLDRATAELQDEKRNSILSSLKDGPLLSLRNELIGTLATLKGDAELARAMFIRANSIPGIPVFRRSALLNNLAQCQIVLDQHSEALRSFEEAISLFPNVSAEIGRIRLLKRLNPGESYVEPLERVLRVAPRNKFVFQSLLEERLSAIA